MVHLGGDLLLLLLVLGIAEVLLLLAVDVDHLLHDEVGVVPLVLPGLAVLDLHHAGGHLVQEVTVVGDHQERQLGGDHVILQPLDGVDVQVRSGLVHHQDVAVGCLDHNPGEHDLGALASGQGVHVTVHHLIGIQPDLGEGLLELVLVGYIAARQLLLQVRVLGGEGVPVDIPALGHLPVDLAHPVLDVLDMPVRPAEDLADGDVR